jgi:uncharacterized protein
MTLQRQTTIPLLGRNAEQQKLRQFLQSKEAELVAIVGRRRVGKTFLVKKVYEKEIAFHITGIQDASKELQMQNFAEARNIFFASASNLPIPESWFQAFLQLKELIGKTRKRKQVLFFDEFPWLASGSYEFIKAFDHFWNTWAIDQNLVVVICGSSATWMITNIINHKGGLHNRVTQKMHLMPFTLLQTEQYFTARNINLPRESIVQIYMALGGIPYYLKDIQRGETAVQIINNLCFGKQAALYGEFDNLYKALFKNYKKHIEIIKALAKKWKGLTRQEIMDYTSMNSGGGLSFILQELEDSHFIQSYIPFGKKQRETLYRLTDEYSLFYLHFIAPNKDQPDYWMKKFNTQEVKIWSGFAFESLCIKHIEGIKQALGISGIYTQQASFIKRKDETGAGCQIDLLIDRADNAINICDMKYYGGLYTLTEAELKNLRQKKNIFQETTKTKKQLFITLITTQGLNSNAFAQLIDKQIDMNALFYESLQ